MTLSAALFAGIVGTMGRGDQVANLPIHARVLFQGDSITDGNRGRSEDPNHILGHGYAFLIAAKAGSVHADRRIEFFNRGISGNRVADLTARWTTDAIDLKPTLISILVGINDVESANDMASFEAQYDALIAQTRTALPTAKIILCEPFGWPVGWRAAKWKEMSGRLTIAQTATKRLAKKYDLGFVPLQQAFNKAIERAPAETWIWDGIHPTYAVHQIIADEWTRVVNAYLRRRP